ncbi:MAG: hypothetical protein KZQ93_13120 [Candidatus Thiodiazotropha sp. (ex Monitilora ramsayi)]|nr:hypothetical protein [Candidatus Thiodiazotropha sp. (ex Monitilora ramsayi)]
MLQKVLWSVFAALMAGSALAGELREFNESSFSALANGKSAILIQINWGRSWGCGGFENAQLQKLHFKQITNDSEGKAIRTLKLETPSRLFVDNKFLPYAYVIDEGKYALSKIDIKVAKSATDIGHLVADETHLFKDGEPVGGTFNVKAGEIVYLGHFGLDCMQQPMLWRYYIEGRSEFERYTAGFHKKFEFAKPVPVKYRLFSTNIFGQAYSID